MNFNIIEFQTTAQNYILNTLMTVDAGIQVGIVLSAFLIGFVVGRFLRPFYDRTVEKLPLHGRPKIIAFNIGKLIIPTIAMVLIFMAAQIAPQITLPDEQTLDITFIDAMGRLLLAWIAIRIAVQLIENAAARNTVALIIWSIAALSIFGILDQTTEAMDAIGMDFGEFRLSVLSVVKGLLAIFALLYIAIFISGFLERKVRSAQSLTMSSRVLISKIIRIALITMALLVGVTSAGVDLSVLAVFSGAVGLGIGFGLQKVVSNLFSGLLLLMDRSIKPGDVLELENGIFGWVQEMGARYTEVVTRDNKSFLIPNEDFITQHVVNWSHGSTLIRLEVEFGVDYRHNPHEIKKIAQEAALLPGRVVKDPAPVCHLAEFGDSSMNFKLRFWIRDAQKGVTNMRGDVMLALWDAFQEHDIVIPYPHRQILMPADSRTA